MVLLPSGGESWPLLSTGWTGAGYLNWNALWIQLLNSPNNSLELHYTLRFSGLWAIQGYKVVTKILRSYNARDEVPTSQMHSNTRLFLGACGVHVVRGAALHSGGLSVSFIRSVNTALLTWHFCTCVTILMIAGKSPSSPFSHDLFIVMCVFGWHRLKSRAILHYPRITGSSEGM